MKISRFLITLLFILSIIFAGVTSNFQFDTFSNSFAQSALSLTTKQQLAKQILVETGIAQRYDQHFDHTIGLVVSSHTTSKFSEWLRSLLAQEAGWKHVENSYITRLVTDFSQAELQELLSLVQQPVMKKLVQSETQAYRDTASARYKLLNAVWNNYQEGKFIPPQDMFK